MATMTAEQYLDLLETQRQQAADQMLYGSLLQLGGGFLSGISNAALQDNIIQANKDLLDQQYADKLKLLQGKRTMVQQGSYFDARIPFRAPQYQRPLRRPDGTLVYGYNGLIGQAMRQQQQGGSV